MDGGHGGNGTAGGSGGGYYDGFIEGGNAGGEGQDGVSCWGGFKDSSGGNGGYGCGGGGAGWNGGGGTSDSGGGGGGGYSGGGGAGCWLSSCSAGGGGSYVDDTYPYDEVITAGGATAPSSYGYVRYQFFCSARFAATPSIIQSAFCYGTESIQFAVENPKWWCDDISYKRVDNNEENTTGIFENLQLGQSYGFELFYAGEVVDTYTHNVTSDVDTEDPSVLCLNNHFVFDLNDNLNPTITLGDIGVSASDACGIAATTIIGYGNSRTFSCDDLGSNTLSVRATDHRGNSATCSVNVEITGGYPDDPPPIVLDLDIFLDANGEATLSESDLLFSANLETICYTRAEAEANYSISAAYQNLDCSDVGTFSFFLDEADTNFPDAEQTITVIDPIPIIASVANVSISLDASGVGTLSMGDLTFTVSDNCYTDAEIIAIYSLPAEFSMFDCMDIGTFPVTLDRSDTNFPSVTFQVTVESSALSFPAVNTDFCSNSSFDLTSLEDDITTASGTFTYTQAIERLYIPNYRDNNVSVVDLNTNSIIQTIAVGSGPWGVAVRPDGKKVYIINRDSHDVNVIDVASNTVEATITVDQFPLGAAFNSDGSLLYVTNIVGNNISVINTTTNTVVNTINLGSAPWGIALSPDDSKIYVASGAGLLVVNASTGVVMTTIPLEVNPKDVAISADGTKVYVSCERGINPNHLKGVLHIIDISTDVMLQTLYLDHRSPYTLAVHPTGDVYAGHESFGGGIISSTSPSNVITYYPIEAGVSNNFRGIDLNEDASRLYLSDSAEDKVFIYNTLTNTVVTSIAVGDAPISTGKFYVKTTLDITSPSNYTPSLGAIVNVAFDGGGECAATTSITFDNEISCVELAVKVFLQGPYDGGSSMMADDLNNNNLLPSSVGGYSMLASATANTGTEAIVDWVTLELRDASDNTVVLASRPALLQADGDVVDMDGTSPVTFTDLNVSSAYVVVRHRNHLGVMTATPISFD